MTIFLKHHPDLAQDANNNDTSHLGGRPTDHYPTDDGRPVGTTTNETTNANFADDTSHFSGCTTNYHTTDDDSKTTNGTTNANFANGTCHPGERPTNHHPTDDAVLSERPTMQTSLTA